MENKSGIKIKVVLVAPSMRQIGGQSIQAKRLLEGFAGDEKIQLDFIPNNPESFAQKIKFLRTVFTSVKFWASLLTKIGKADVVHVFSSGTTSYIISTLPPLIAAKLYGKKTILHYHTGEAEQHLKDWRRSAQTMRKFDEIIVPSQFLVDVFAKFGFRAEAIFNFVETEKFKFRQRKPLRPVFLSNRNFEAHYQVADVLRAFPLIKEKFSEAQLIVTGSGSEEFELKKLAVELKLKNVEFAGRVAPEKMPEFYEKADIYLNASVVDNMPLSIIEAYSVGLPVISTNAGGIPYILENETTGLLVETKDYKSLAQSAIRLLEDQNLAQKIIENARSYGENFTWQKVRAKWVDVYAKLAE